MYIEELKKNAIKSSSKQRPHYFFLQIMYIEKLKNLQKKVV